MIDFFVILLVTQAIFISLGNPLPHSPHQTGIFRPRPGAFQGTHQPFNTGFHQGGGPAGGSNQGFRNNFNQGGFSNDFNQGFRNNFNQGSGNGFHNQGFRNNFNQGSRNGFHNQGFRNNFNQGSRNGFHNQGGFGGGLPGGYNQGGFGNQGFSSTPRIHFGTNPGFQSGNNQIRFHYPNSQPNVPNNQRDNNYQNEFSASKVVSGPKKTQQIAVRTQEAHSSPKPNQGGTQENQKHGGTGHLPHTHQNLRTFIQPPSEHLHCTKYNQYYDYCVSHVHR